MQLVHAATRKPVAVGDRLVSFRGESATLAYIEPPHKPASTGRVYVYWDWATQQSGYFPGVFNLVWEGRTDA